MTVILCTLVTVVSLVLCSNARNPICIGHPCQLSTLCDAAVEISNCSMRSWQLFLRILHI